MNTRYLAFTILLLLPLLANAQRRLDLHNYEMVWRDEFDYPDVDSMLNSDNWVVGWPGNIQGIAQFHLWEQYANNGRPYAVEFTPDNISVENGHASFWGSKCDTIGSCDSLSLNGISYQVGSFGGAITSTYDQDYRCVEYYNNGNDSLIVEGFNYGIFEIRAKLPIGKKDFSYFWLWGPYWQCGNEDHHFSCGNDVPGESPCQLPYCSGIEIDVFETSYDDYHGVDEFRYFSTIQPNNADASPYPEPHQCSSCPTYYKWLNSDPGETWHTYALAWTPDSATWFIDGNEVRTQRDYIPDFKMVLNLGANLTSYTSEGPQGKLVVDYLRVYRPTGGSYGVITDTFPSSRMFTSRSDTAYDDYVALYRDTAISYFNLDNYRFKEADEMPLDEGLTPTSSAIIEPFDSLVQQEIVPRAYFTLGDNKLYRTELQYRRSYLQYSDGLFARQYNGGGLPWPKSEIKSIHEDHGSMSLFPVVGHLFWRGTDNRMYMRINLDSIMPEDELYVVQMDTAQDVYGDVVAVEGSEIDTTALHPSRVYYRDKYETLCYFEWDLVDSVWKRKVTGINNVAGNLVAAKVPLGKLYYRGTDHKVWNVWQYAGGPASFQNSPVDSVADFNVPGLPGLGALAVSPDGYRVYYTSYHDASDMLRADIKCLEYNGNSTWSRRSTGVDDFTGGRMEVFSLPVAEQADEIIYMGASDTLYLLALDKRYKLKSLYMRPMKGRWEDSLSVTPYADTCVTTFDNMTLTHRPTYFVESHFYIDNWFGASHSEPRVAFAMAQSLDEMGTIGFYRRGSCELCPLVYEDCTWNPEVVNEIELRTAPYERAALQVYPNPTTGEAHVVLPSGRQANGVWLTALNGRHLSFELHGDGSVINLDFSGQAPGVYALQVLLDDGTLLSTKIILETNP